MKEAIIVGVANLTPDSFSGDGTYSEGYYDVEAAEQVVNEHFEDGASLVDIGAESTRYGATPITPEAEWARLEDVLYRVVPGRESGFSIDTHHPATVRKICETLGVVTINDVTGMNNPKMRRAIAECGMPIIIGHLDRQAGTDIQWAHQIKPTTDIRQIVDDFNRNIDELIQLGVPQESITLDPDWGFGKVPELHQHLFELPSLMPNFPWMLGVSRKNSLRRRDFHREDLADFEAMSTEEERVWLDNRSVEVAVEGFAAGYRYFRVHNVAAHASRLSGLMG